MPSSYRMTLIARDGSIKVREVDQDGYDELVDTYEVLDSDFPAATRERQLRDGSWRTDGGGWDTRARIPSAQQIQAPHDYVSDMVETARLNDIADRRQVRQDYYRRTGR